MEWLKPTDAMAVNVGGTSLDRLISLSMFYVFAYSSPPCARGADASPF